MYLENNLLLIIYYQNILNIKSIGTIDYNFKVITLYYNPYPYTKQYI